MSLKFIQTKYSNYIVDIDNTPHYPKGIINGQYLRLVCEISETTNNKTNKLTKSTSYNSYYSPSIVQVCHKTDIIRQRDLKPIEYSILEHAKQNLPYTKEEKKYIKENFSKHI